MVLVCQINLPDPVEMPELQLTSQQCWSIGLHAVESDQDWEHLEGAGVFEAAVAWLYDFTARLVVVL